MFFFRECKKRIFFHGMPHAHIPCCQLSVNENNLVQGTLPSIGEHKSALNTCHTTLEISGSVSVYGTHIYCNNRNYKSPSCFCDDVARLWQLWEKSLNNFHNEPRVGQHFSALKWSVTEMQQWITNIHFLEVRIKNIHMSNKNKEEIFTVESNNYLILNKSVVMFYKRKPLDLKKKKRLVKISSPFI